MSKKKKDFCQKINMVQKEKKKKIVYTPQNNCKTTGIFIINKIVSVLFKLLN